MMNFLRRAASKGRLFVRRWGAGDFSERQRKGEFKGGVAEFDGGTPDLTGHGGTHDAAELAVGLQVQPDDTDLTRRRQFERPVQSAQDQVGGGDELSSVQPGLRKRLAPIGRIGGMWQTSADDAPVLLVSGIDQRLRPALLACFPQHRVAIVRAGATAPEVRAAVDQFDRLDVLVRPFKELGVLGELVDARSVSVFRCQHGLLGANFSATQSESLTSIIVDQRGLLAPDQSAQLGGKSSYCNGLTNAAIEFKNLPAAHGLRRIYNELGLASGSRVGRHRFAKTTFGPRFKERILVVEEAQDQLEAPVNPLRWDVNSLIDWAGLQFPGAQIVVLRRHRNRTASGGDIYREGVIYLESDHDIHDLLNHIDRVVTISSRIGLDAVLREIPVSLAGLPIYAGWGLTDDRLTGLSRGQILTADQLFEFLFLQSSIYSIAPSDPVEGCLTTMLHAASKSTRAQRTYFAHHATPNRTEEAARSPYWPVLLGVEQVKQTLNKHGKSFVNVLPVGRFLEISKASFFQEVVAHLLSGLLLGTAGFNRLLSQFRVELSAPIFRAILEKLWQVRASRTVLVHWAWLQEQSGDLKSARETLEFLAHVDSYSDMKPGLIRLDSARRPLVLMLAQFHVRHRSLTEARALYLQLLISGECTADVLGGLAEIASLGFDFESAAAIHFLINHSGIPGSTSKTLLLEAQANILIRRPSRALLCAALACTDDPQYVESIAASEDVLQRMLGPLPVASSLLRLSDADAEVGSLSLARAFVTRERPLDAERVLLEYEPKPREIERYTILLSQAKSYQGRLDDARAIVERMIQDRPTVALLREALRLAVLMNDYSWGRKLLGIVADNAIDVGDVYERKIRLSFGEIRESYLGFRAARANAILRTYLGSKSIVSLAEVPRTPGKTVLVVACFGPGDEIRFASLYRQMRLMLPDASMTFTCDPRILGLLQRNYADLDFFPVTRIRSLAWLDNLSNHDQLPGSDLHIYFDNRSWEFAQQADYVISVPCALGDVLQDYSSFTGSRYLVANPSKVDFWKGRLAAVTNGTPFVGLSWRSSITTYNRNEHYLRVEDLVPVLQVEGVQFINLQYDDCQAELEWIEKHHPGKVLNFSDLDQFNDLEGVAALMKCLDLVIAPATTVLELAGAIGCEALFLSNSSELHWRRNPDTLRDVWHSSVRHVEGAVLGSRASLAEATAVALRTHLIGR